MMKGVLLHALVLLSLTLNATAGKTPEDAVHPDDYYKKFNKPNNKHTMVKYKGIGKNCRLSKNKVVVRSGPVKPDEIKRFLKVHNDYRRRVAKGLETKGAPGPQPPAANMREVVWDHELAAFAQRWVEQCPGEVGVPPHDKNRRNDRYIGVGQNMFSDVESSVPIFGLADPPLTANVEKALSFFYMEVGIPGFNKSQVDPFRFKHRTGHYSQLVWANVERIGCGFLMLKESTSHIFYTTYEWPRYVICNYGPAGNLNGLSIYKIGPAGSKCPKGTVNHDGLCRATAALKASDRSNMQPSSDKGCGMDMFKCKSGHCIPNKWRCDKHKDCPGGCDEKGCALLTFLRHLLPQHHTRNVVH